MGLKTVVVLYFCVLVPIVLGKKTTSTTAKTTTTAAAAAPASTNYYPPATYNLVHDYQAGTSSFWSNWNFFTGPDPTDGFVKYESGFI